MRITTKILGLLALFVAFTTAAVAAPANSTRIPSAKGEYKVAASNQVCCQVGDDEDWSPSWQSCLGHLGKVVSNNACTDDSADDDDGGPDDGVDDDDGGPDDGVDDGKDDGDDKDD